MSKLSFTDKLSVLLDVTRSSTLHIILIAVFVFLGVVLATTRPKNKNRNKLIYIIVTAFLLAFIIITYHASLANMFSYMMNNFFIAVYFPNIAIYFAAIIATNIILWTSIFNYKTTKKIKILNVIIYTIMHYILILLLNVINTNKLDIFTQSSIYENKEATALIELSSLVFVVWIIFLIVYKIILTYIRKDYKPVVKKVIIKKKVKKLPENYEPLRSPLYVYGKTNNNKYKYNNEPLVDLNKLYEKPINDEKELLKKQFDNMFTLDDYKVMSKILQEQKEKELEEKINLRNKLIEQNKEEIKQRETTEELILKVRQKAEEEKQKRREQKEKEAEEIRKQQLITASVDEEENKYQELLNLYRVK